MFICQEHEQRRGLHELWSFITFRVRECIDYPTGYYAEREVVLEESAAAPLWFVSHELASWLQL